MSNLTKPPMLNLHFPSLPFSLDHPNISLAIILAHISTTALEWLPVAFRVMAILVAAPIVVLAMLDIAAYMIARTLGHPHPKPLDPSSIKIGPSPVQIDACKVLDIPNDDSHIPSIQVTNSSTTTTQISSSPPSPITEFPHHFTSPSEGIFALSGEGVFSPPISRSNTPPLERIRRRRSQSNASYCTSDDGESDRSSSIGLGSALTRRGSSTSPDSDHNQTSPSKSVSTTSKIRHRKNPQFQFTPMNQIA